MSELDVVIARVLQPGFVGTSPPDWLRRRLAGGLGSVILFAANMESPEQARTLTNELRAENPDVFVAVDEEAGDITRLEAATGSSYPGNLALGAIDDIALTEATARSIGALVHSAGIDLTYAPVADVNTEPRNPVIGARSFGADPALVARHVAATVRGLHTAGVAACAKHFPGHGDTVIDSHFGLPTVTATLEQLRHDTLPPFSAAVAAGVRAVMVAHLLMPEFDTEHPASVSPAVIGGLLRTELGFDGLAVSDAIGMAAVRERYGLASAAVRALVAGIDMVCVDSDSTDADLAAITDAITAALRDGTLSEARLVEAAEKVAGFAAWRREARDASVSVFDAPLGDGLAAARRAVAVLRADDGALPLKSAPHVVEVDLPRSMADHLATLLPGTTNSKLSDTIDAAAATGSFAIPADQPLVVVVRGIQRSPEDLDRVARLVKERPDAIVVDLGVAHIDPGGAAWVAGYGVSRVSLQAVAEVLAGR
ncbi:glycoside hydrolase family 3 domain protein [Catenulispora acidiphila DSM 44928]|uniref:Glycoside hydrolase family 3 domain protein n=1 Tax=Catenulispora acidiphila (strain DSM 44928 / JCM 14897 / NBRC 102108 / NRRL B-24433 / ID139908) TaxID=479433 RepID=C7PWC7_CATAD|nr:glycoside hydrolase family 3 N-terminal domain-containing protein [Catenulispora acidiphila]ACU73375.1 glycoside hydrolase family 3 domain protein [Catenulispora acidiphila DSM 44928]